MYLGDAPSPDMSLFVLDNKLKVFQRVRTEESELEFEDEVDLLMSGDIISAQISTKPINFTKAQSGWFFKEDSKRARPSTILLTNTSLLMIVGCEMIGSYPATFYSVNGISLETRKRREHLSHEDLQKNKALLENFAKGNLEQNGEEFPRKESLPPPPPTNVTWDEYLNAEPGKHPVLGRHLICKESSKGFKPTVAMSEEFPLTVEMLLNVLEVRKEIIDALEAL